MAETTLSFIIPTRGRPDVLRRLCASIETCTAHRDRLELVLVADAEDASSAAFQYPGLRIRNITVPPGMSMGSLNMAGYHASTGRYLMLMNDDVVIRTPAWDERLQEVLEQYPDGIVLVHVNDLCFGEKLCTFPVLSRTFCEMAGGICPEGYHRYCIDNHIQNVFDLLSLSGYRRRVFLPDVVFEHTNVTESQGAAHYAPDPQILSADTRLFEGLLPDRRRLAAEAAKRIGRDAIQPAPVTVTVAVISSDADSEQTRGCVERLRATTPDYVLLVVREEEGGSRGQVINRLLESCETHYLAVVDQSALVAPHWLEGLLRAAEPGVGVVTPVHDGPTGKLSYAGLTLQPDNSGYYAPVLAIGERPRHTEALDATVMLIDAARCGAIRLDEKYAGDYLAIDYGLRFWEEGFRSVCSPWSRVSVAGHTERAEDDLQRLRFVREWLESGRLDQLRMRFWGAVEEFVEFAALKDNTDALFAAIDSVPLDDFFLRARAAMESVEHLPALRNYASARARSELGPRAARADDPKYGNWATLLGITGQPVLYQRGVYGFSVVLRGSRFYAIPGPEEEFDYARLRTCGYARSFESEGPHRIRSLIVRQWPRTLQGHLADGAPPAAGLDSVWPKLNLHTEAVPVLFDRRGYATVLQRLIRAIPYWGLLRSAPELFDRDYYRKRYPEIADAGADPMLHFIIAGAFEGCQPHPLFDPAFYFWNCPDVREANVNPLGHYLRCGAAESRRPHPLFDTAYYLEKYPDVRQRGMNPLLHYVSCGAAEGRQPHPWFIPEYYLEQCPAARQSRNPLVHFLEPSGTEFYSPHPQFDCTYYVSQMPAGSPVYINPLVHYVLFGASRGLLPSAGFSATAQGL